MKSKGIHFLEEPREEEYGTVVVFADLYGNKWDLLELKKRGNQILLTDTIKRDTTGKMTSR